MLKPRNESVMTMKEHRECAVELKAELHQAFPSLTYDQIRLDGGGGGSTMVDINLGLKNEWVCIEVKTTLSYHAVQYGFSIMDKDSGYGEGPDCEFGHIPTMIKYMKRLFPNLPG
jgi:hypothetical protein